MTAQGYYGNRVVQADRGVASQPFLSQTGSNLPLAVTRIRHIDPRPDLTRLSSEDALVLSVSVKGTARRELFVGNSARPVDTPIIEGSFSFFDMRQDAAIRVLNPHDCVQFYVPIGFLNSIAYDIGLAHLDDFGLKSGDVVADDTLRHLAYALILPFLHPEQVDQLFIDHMTRAAATHLARTYGRAVARRTWRGGLAPWQERRIKEMLDADLSGNISLNELASECGLSTGHFTRAFRRSSGLSPHQWLLRQRIDRSKTMMQLTQQSLAEIAETCGFADQSHFTRVFTKIVGISPAAWRRQK